METIVKLILPFLSTPKNYEDVLKKLAGCAFYEAYLITLILRANPQFDAFITSFESWGPIGKVVAIIPHHDVLDPAGIAIAFAIALLSHMFELHDRISDVLGIRRTFDCQKILVPLSEQVGSPVTKEKEIKIEKHHDELMHRVFYKYASSRVEHSFVDKHDIEHALNAWSWFWVFVEATFYFFIGSAIAWILGSHNISLKFGMLSVVLISISILQYPRLARYARPQIDSIANDATAAVYVKQQFDAL